MTSSAQLPSYTPERRMLIDGELVASADGGEFDNVNPATEEVLGQVTDGTAGTPNEVTRMRADHQSGLGHCSSSRFKRSCKPGAPWSGQG